MQEASDLLDETTTTGEKRISRENGILAQGIVSIPFALGIIGLILAIATIVQSKKAIEEYNSNPGIYRAHSLKKVKAGRTCAIISLSLFALGIILVISISI